MRITVPRESRRRITAALLAAAERMPSGRFKIADRLQDIAQWQRDDARRFVDSVASAPYSLRYIGFSLVELFPRELRSEVETALEAMFPLREREQDREPHSSPFSISSRRLGRIFPVRPSGLIAPPGSYAIMPELPPWVAYVEICTSQEHSSSFLVVANVTTAVKLDDQIRDRMMTPVEGHVVLDRLLDLRYLGFAYSQQPTELAYGIEFQNFLSSLRAAVERPIFGKLKPRGYFLSHEKALPAVEIMEIDGDVPAGEDWVAATRRWRFALDLDFELDYYKGENLILATERSFDEVHPPVWTLAYRPDYQPPRSVGDRDESRAGIARRIHEALSFSQHNLAISAHQQVLARLVSRFRRKVFLSAGQRFNIPAQSKLYEEILDQRTFFLRAKADFNDPHAIALFGQDQLLHALKSGTASDKDDSKPGDDAIRERLRWMYDVLTAAIDDVRTSYSDVLAARNYRATHLLARAALVVAFTSCLVALTSLGIAVLNRFSPVQPNAAQRSPLPPPLPSRTRAQP